MRPGLLVIGILALSPLCAGAQTANVRWGTITYVSGDVYYVSLGSPSGVKDSTLVRVVDGADTVATLKIFAVSSKSSACRVVASTRAPRQGDAVVVRLAVPQGEPPVPDSSVPALSPGVAAETTSAGPRKYPRDAPAVTVRGRVSAQYQTYIPGSSAATVTQPSLSLNLRGDASGAPVRFEIAGVLRSSVTGTSGPFTSGAVNRSRVYRLSVEFDDSLNRAGLGRLFPFAGLPSGYIDGLVASRKVGIVEIGAAAGFEPDFRQEKFISDWKKVMVFAGASSVEPFGWSMTAGYSKSFLRSSAERSVLSGSATLAPSRALFFSAQSEVDFLSVKNSTVVSKPKLTSLIAHLSWRASDMLTVGAGMTAWRPVYPLSLVSVLPDSMKDDRLWVSPSVSIRLFPGWGFNIREQYSPRTTPDGFGEEYSNTVSVGYDNILQSGVAVRASHSLNKSSLAASTGYAFSLRRSVGVSADAGLRYQYYLHDFERGPEESRTRSVGADLSFALSNPLYLMLSGELSFGSISDYRLFSGSLSWRF